MLDHPFKIIDISQPVSSESACFPGDTPFQKSVTLTYKESGIVNLTALTMSPHVGTHADAPVHVTGELGITGGTAADLPLERFIGPALVIDLAPIKRGITKADLIQGLDGFDSIPERVLFRTCHHIRYEIFEQEYAYIAEDLAEELADRGVKLVGLDTPSVDHVDSKSLAAHHILLERGLSWLENLDLTDVAAGIYTLVALPLRFEELEASPVRAVLLATPERTK